MKITWNTTMQQIICAMGLENRPWLIDAYLDDFFSARLPGRRFGEVPLGELAQKGMMQPRPSVVSGFRFLLDRWEEKPCFYDIWEDFSDGRERTGLFAFPVPGAKRFLLIIPGGGYSRVCSFIEGFPIAESCARQGIASFILNYRTADAAHYPNPQVDAAQAVKFILSHAAQFELAGTEYAVCGFSAGGHLAACLGTESLGYARFGIPRPQAEILGYPVVTMGALTHDGSRANLLKEDAGAAQVQQQWSVEQQVSASYPPTFLWNCAEDDCVPAANSAMLEAALIENGVPVCHEVYPGTVHGWGLADGTPAEGWLDRAITFWREHNENK